MSKKDETITEIKSKGYWVINIHPVDYQEKLIKDRVSVKEVVRNAVVELRGWDYPHFRDSEGEPYTIGNGIEKVFSWENHIELWRMTQSGNFLHLLALREDRLDFSNYRNIWSHGDELKDKKLLGVLGTLYTLVEIFEFTKRLIKQDIFSTNLVIDIKLHDIDERQLYVDSQGRIPFSFPRMAHSTDPWVWKKEYELVDFPEKVQEYSLEAFLDLVDLFGWENPPIEVYKNDIQKFLEGKI